MQNASDLDVSRRVIYEGAVLSDHSTCAVTVERIGRGGFGVVYMGPDRMWNGQWVALKTLKPELLRVGRVRELFIREGCTWLGLWPHANVLSARFLTEVNLQLFLKLEYAENGTMRDHLRRSTLPLQQGLEWAQQIAAGLAYLHTPDPTYLRPEPLVHRDLKPENVLIDGNGRAKITDFGLAKVVAGDSAALAVLEALQAREGDAAGGQARSWKAALRSQHYQTARGAGLGTPAYMAPEQWEGAAGVGLEADVYAFGIILSEVLAGRHALLDLDTWHSEAEWRRAHVDGRPRRLREGEPQTPAEVEALYEACLAKAPEARPSSAAALEALQAGAQALGYQPYTVPETIPHVLHNEVRHWHNWSIAYLHFQLYPEALDRNERALALDPQDMAALLTHGNILQQMGQIDEALAAFDAALARLPPEDRVGRKRVWFNRGNALSQSGRRVEAEAAYAEAVTLMPEAATSWFNRARNLCLWTQTDVKVGRWAQARAHAQLGITCAEQVLQLNPEYPQVRELLALLHQLLATLDT